MGTGAPAQIAAASGPKVAIIVGPAGSETAQLRKLGDSAATAARRYTSNVVRVYSPSATWSRVRSAMSGAAVVIYFGRGRGYPSPYSSSLRTATEDGFALNSAAGHGNSNARFYGERYIRQVPLARDAAVLIYKAPYASGTGELGMAQPRLSIARRRVDNYGAGFLAAGASVVIAERSGGLSYYIRSIFTRSISLDRMWREAPTANGHATSFTSSRTAGAIGRTDPVSVHARYYRSIIGRVGTSTAAVRGDPAPIATPTPTPAGTPTPLPAAVAYGPAINADDLNNSQVGGPDSRKVSYRFRATTSSALTAIRIYIVTGSGYSGGTGGTLEVSVQADDGTAAHLPSGTAIASSSFRASSPISNSGLPLITFGNPASLVSGRLYHVVFRNVDPSPTVNYVSVDGLFTYGDQSPWQPGVSNMDWANLVWFRGAWSADRGAGQGVITPIMELTYANGRVAGVGYMEVWVGLPKTVSGSHAVREVFTVSGSARVVSGVSVRLKRTSGAGALQVRLETSSGALVEQGSIPASSIPTTGKGAWATLRFTAKHTLAVGQGYRLVLTAAADTVYSTFVIREGGAFSFDPQTYFADGTGEYNPGNGWVGFDQPGGRTNLTMGDLQFYFR